MLFNLIKKYIALYVLGRIFAAFISFLAIVFLVRSLSASDYGKYALLFGMGNLLAIVLYRCLSQSVLRFYSAYAQNEELAKKVLSQVLFLLIVIDSIVLIAGLVIGAVWHQNFFYIMFVTLFAIGLGHFFVNEALLQAQIKKYYSIAVLMLKSTLNLVLLLIFISAGFQVYGALAAIVTALLIVAIWVWFTSWRNIKIQLDLVLLKKMASYGLIALLIFSANYLVGYLDRYLLALLDSLRSSGVYSSVYDITYQAITTVLYAVTMGIAPLLFRAYEEDRAEFRQLLSANVTLVASLGSYLLVIAIVFASKAALFFTKASASDHVNLIIPLIVTMCFLMCFKAYCFDVLFQAKKKLYVVLVVFILMIVVNIAANVYLIPRFGVLGASLSGVISAVVGILVTFLYAREEYLAMLPKADLLKLLTCSLACVGLGVFFLSVSSFVLIAAKFVLISVLFALLYVMLNVAGSRSLLSK